MIRDITLGQYYAAESVVHRVDPRVKIIATLLFIAELFIVDDFKGFILCGGAMALAVAASKVHLGFIMRGLKPILFILMFTFVLNIFMIDGHILVKLWFIKITKEGLLTAAFMAIRLILLIIGSSLLTFTTKPIILTDGIEKLLAPLKAFKVPTHEIAMMMSIALRFIPTLIEETDKIMKAQQARGADFESGNIMQRAKALIPILVPLFISAFQIAQDLAMAMEARCYRGGTGRTRMHAMKLMRRDYFVAIGLVLLLGLVILERIYL